MNKLKLAMFRELGISRTWAARWKTAAKEGRVETRLNNDRAKAWRKQYENTCDQDQFKAAPALLQTCEAHLAEELRRRAELEQELRLNASMLARQCDLAREAEMKCARDNKALKTVEAERDDAIQEKHRAWASLDHAIEENRRVERERDGLKHELEALREVARLAESLVNNFPSFDDLWEALDKLEEVNRE